ncbi:glycosyl hydrolase family 79 C-terminal domain-containing protein [Aspergillus fijiensis CBS 313.89]|uniref:Beta-glucuronidase C-terminal domain-containing protein n=1 Tax=Aspergillus fijiensis CBS 313.89 TaxID=1448319 RepID=A0A8G1RXA4_9EURO|nr:uncharacterized protein BO72DRAFT_465125 [Aspergillus fijiensis CBS 313.89]RAK81712.1 hypothetical protein BO72DRAFT_465125 [Aspergillus fijiensis CBS 313.89]
MKAFSLYLLLTLCNLLHLGGWAIASTVYNVTSTVSLAPASSPRPEKPVHDADYHSFSIEFCYIVDYAGNDTHPNLFSRQVIQNLKDIAGKAPIFRVGGSTQNSAVYYPDQTEALIDPFDSIASSQPRHSYFGPAFLQSFRQFPAGSKYIFGLNFFNAENETLFDVGDGLAQCVLEAHAAYHAIGDALYGFEIGNEVDSWARGQRRPANWTIQDYVDQWNEYASAISKNLTQHDADQLFQGCAFEAPRHVTAATDWNVANAEADGMRADKAKSVADHEYMGAACDYTGVGPTIATTIFDRTNVLSRVWYHDYLGNVTAASDIPYVLGETNSISCQGARGISDVMAAAVWAVDYVLYLSSLRVERVHFHMGTRYPYASWLPVTFNETAPTQTEVLVNTTDFGAYAVYDNGQLESLVAVSLSVWNSTSPAAQRPYTALELPAAGWENAKVMRLTNPGVDVAANITLAGQSVNTQGEIVGIAEYEKVQRRKVWVGAGEAVLIKRG